MAVTVFVAVEGPTVDVRVGTLLSLSGSGSVRDMLTSSEPSSDALADSVGVPGGVMVEVPMDAVAVLDELWVSSSVSVCDKTSLDMVIDALSETDVDKVIGCVTEMLGDCSTSSVGVQVSEADSDGESDLRVETVSCNSFDTVKRVGVGDFVPEATAENV